MSAKNDVNREGELEGIHSSVDGKERLAGDCGRGRAFGPREKEGVRPINRFLENAMMRREAALALQCTKRTKRVGGSQKGPRGPPGEGEVSLAKMAKVMQRCDKSEDVSTAGLAECVRAEGEASRAGCGNDVENSVKCGRFRRHSHGYIVSGG